MNNNDNNWISRANCRGIPNATKIFFLERGMNSSAAKKICKTCSVSSECLEYALSFSLREDSFGIFGGMTPQEREDLRRNRESNKVEINSSSTQS